LEDFREEAQEALCDFEVAQSGLLVEHHAAEVGDDAYAPVALVRVSGQLEDYVLFEKKLLLVVESGQSINHVVDHIATVLEVDWHQSV